MDVVTAIAVFNAIIAAAPNLASLIKTIAAQFAHDHGLDPVAIVKQITPDEHEQVDAMIDARLEGQPWTK